MAPAYMLPDVADVDDAPDGAYMPLDAHSQYSREALTHRLLSTDEERELARRWREMRDQGARRTLIECNLKMVYAIAQQYHGVHLSRLDLVQEGTIGLMHAIDLYDETTGYALSTYATRWIRQAIGRALEDRERAIRVPSHVQQVTGMAARTRTRLAMALGREPRETEVIAAMKPPQGMSRAEMITALARGDAAAHVAYSLDVEMPNADGVTLGDTIPDEAAAEDGAQDVAEHGEMSARLWAAIRGALTPREREVIVLRFGLDGGDGMTDREWARVPLGALPVRALSGGTASGETRTLADVATRLRISRERARQLEMAALGKLRARLSAAGAHPADQATAAA